MKRILVPVDGSPRSLIALEQVKANFSPKVFEIVLVMVHENVGVIKDTFEEDAIRTDLMDKLDVIANNLEKYQVIKKALIGKAGTRIIECANETACDMIVLTKSTKPNHSNTIGITASHVISKAPCNVFVVQDKIKDSSNEYRGLVYKTAEGTVTLRGQLSLKQSECMLPSVAGDVIYQISVIRGRVRFLHKSYNADAKEWNLLPENGQTDSVDVAEGETVEIPVNATNSSNVIDRIRVINRNMKTEAVFSYKISVDKSKQEANQ